MSGRSGTAQEERMPQALREHYVDVDELTLAQLLTIALDSAGAVGFDGNVPGAGWDAYFENDEIMVFARILCARTHAATARFERLLARDADGAAAMLAAWLEALRAWSGALLHHGAAEGTDLGAMLAALQVQLAQAVGEAQAGADAAAQQQRLRERFHRAMKAVEIAQRAAAARLPHALRSGDHDPGVGMLVAFAQLYRRAQEKLNRFSARHLDFYYDEVLHVRPRGPERDAAFLVFEAAAAGMTVPIPAGTRFLAQYERGVPELEFVTEHPIVVTDARVVALHTVYFERNRLSSPEASLSDRMGGHGSSGPRTRRYPTACRLNRIEPVAPARLRKDDDGKAAPLFGAPRTAGTAPPGTAARIGFVLASNVLLMQHGERKVDVALRLGRDRDGHGATLGQRLDALVAVAPSMDRTEVLYRALGRMFRISISGSAGWIEVAEYMAAFEHGADGVDTLRLSFRLGPEAPAVVPYAPILHGERYPSDCPVLRFELNPLAYVQPYGLLRGLPLLRATIEVDVRGHRTLELQNQMGLLSAAAPFQPFGPLPAPGAYLIVGSAEAACKNLASFDLVLEWGGLPRAPRGLGDYYAGYAGERIATPFGDVRASLSVLSDGAWVPAAEAERPQVTLFAAAAGPAAEPVAAARYVRFTRVLAQARRVGRVDGPAPFVYTPGVQGGFFKVTLTGPDFLFGHREYPFVLADTLGYNGQPRNRARLRALPATPYTPLLDAVRVDYRAHAEISAAPSAAGDAFLRLSPLGWDAARGAGQGRDLLLPRFEHDGNLYIGLSASELRAPLTLFFHLREDALPMAELTERELRWSYLADNAWYDFKPYAVRADSTHAFLRAGIVTLTLPSDISNDNTELPAGLYWLRVSCDTDLASFCSLYSVSTHAALVVRDLDVAPAPGAPASVPAGTITRSRQLIPGLGRVTQVSPSFGGRLAESRHDLRQRTAERLRHKGQAITPNDYERLILERFPQIDRVKCFANRSVAMGTPDGRRPGTVLVVGLPAYRSDGYLADLPRLDGYLIGQVRRFLEAHVSPAVRLEVVNPVYQHIQVRCTVSVRAGADLGWYANELDTLVSDFISPWSRFGNTCHFGWSIRRHDIESFLLAQDGVLAVSGLSMLSVSGRDPDLDLYSLTDTAAPAATGVPADDAVADMVGEPVIEPAHPWSIAVPMKRHHIAVRHAGAPAAASPTGIGRMEIGSTFIIGARRDEE